MTYYLLTYLLKSFPLPIAFQAIPFEIALKNQKWLLVSVYNPDKSFGKYFLECLTTLLDYYTRTYNSYVIIGDMNLEPHKEPMKQFIENNNLYNLINKPTCFKSTNGSCIDLILTNKKFSFVIFIRSGLGEMQYSSTKGKPIQNGHVSMCQ